MDPNETLAILRQAVAEFQRIYDDSNQYAAAARRQGAVMRHARSGADNELIDLGDTLAEAFTALDGWLSTGGFQPKWEATK